MTTIDTRPHPTRTSRPPLRHLLCALGAVGVVLAAAACTADTPSSALPGATGDADPGSTPSASASLDPEDAMLQWARCMREQGVDVPDPVDGKVTVDGKGLSPEQMQAAEDACATWQEMAEPQDDGRELSEEQKQAFLDQAQCMRDRGWDVSDPEFDGGRVTQHHHRSPDGAATPGEPKPGDPQFEQDLLECADEAGVEPPQNEG
ncbi:hypothetical protein Cch01nite_35270 [Cellulomonas chitinilytica]|uniref:Lipoprotein n=1 Tax=Cellulomonas chitinilytica TaxID=398759 RepID=A0A919P3Z4_9CELL|nr:hypothetical protein [Cellulomonas chitinilytica]GIG22803.1 hypothetical protein Cch01nite_35270 [Cellulomonas chitinilytica]